MSKEKPLRDEYDLKKQKLVDDKKTHDYILAGKYHEKRPNYSHQADIMTLGDDNPKYITKLIIKYIRMKNLKKLMQFYLL